MRTVLRDLIFRYNFTVLTNNTRLLHTVSKAYIRLGSGKYNLFINYFKSERTHRRVGYNHLTQGKESETTPL